MEAEDQPVIPTDTGSARLSGQDLVSNSNNYIRGHGLQILKPVRTSLSFVSSSEFPQGLSGTCQIVLGMQVLTEVYLACSGGLHATRGWGGVVPRVTCESNLVPSALEGLIKVSTMCSGFMSRVSLLLFLEHMWA